MNATKVKNFRQTWNRGPATESHVLRNLPEDLIDQLPGRLLGRVAQVVEAAYLDGYAAAGGNTLDPVEHCETHRQAIISQTQ